MPQHLSITPGAAGSQTLFAHCDDARRATGYRFTVTNATGESQPCEALAAVAP